VTDDPYPLRDAASYPNGQLRLGARVYRFQCSICHTLSGANGLTHLTGSWMMGQKRLNIAKLQHTKPFMPPFAGTAAEVEALVQFLDWCGWGRPADWPVNDDPRILDQIGQWLKEAGTAPSTPRIHGTTLAETD
jgi:cytochrome d ubiquinol oxidase subunit I